MVAHALVDDRVAAGLANDQIGPLHDDDRHEEGRVARVLELLASVVGLPQTKSDIIIIIKSATESVVPAGKRNQRTRAYPFLSVRVNEVVDGPRVPLLADAEESARTESVLGHDDEVDEEAGRRLHHADLAVRHRDQPVGSWRRRQTRNKLGQSRTRNVHPPRATPTARLRIDPVPIKSGINPETSWMRVSNDHCCSYEHDARLVKKEQVVIVVIVTVVVEVRKGKKEQVMRQKTKKMASKGRKERRKKGRSLRIASRSTQSVKYTALEEGKDYAIHTTLIGRGQRGRCQSERRKEEEKTTTATSKATCHREALGIRRKQSNRYASKAARLAAALAASS